MNHTTIKSSQPLPKTILHVNMNNYHFDTLNRLRADDEQFIADLNNFLPTLNTNKQQIFRAVSFENMSFKLSSAIKDACEKANIKSYGMITDETARKGYMEQVCAQSKVQHLNIKTSGLKQKTAENTLDK